jgi:putative DNA primase/helicase
VSAGRLASEVQPRVVEWLWHPFIPLGKLSAVAGQMGQGKSLLTVWIAAAVSQGRAPALGDPGHVLMLSAEDDPEDTTVPCLLAANADLDRVTLLEDWTLDATSLEERCEAIHDVKLITVDPLSAYLDAKVDSWKAQHVRRALEPIRRLAQERGIAVLLVQHLNRRAEATDALARIADSQGIPALARSVLIWGPDPADPDGDQGSRKALTRAKANLARAGAAAAFQIVETSVSGGIIKPKLIHVGDADVRANDVVSSENVRTQTEAAMVFLRDFLAGGPQEAEVIKSAAEAAGVTDKCLRTARERLCRPSYRPQGNHGPYVWELSPDKTKGIHGYTRAPTGRRDQSADARPPMDAHRAPAPTAREGIAVSGPTDAEPPRPCSDGVPPASRSPLPQGSRVRGGGDGNAGRDGDAPAPISGVLGPLDADGGWR